MLNVIFPNNRPSICYSLWVRECSKCRTLKPVSEFHRRKEGDGYRRDCKQCVDRRQKLRALNFPKLEADRKRRNGIRFRFGMSVEEYDDAIAKGCVVCGSHNAVGMDHCHATGKLRGALCRRCNLALGYVNDDPVLLRKLANYIENYIAPKAEEL